MSEPVPLICIGGSESLGITLSKEKLDQRGIEAGEGVLLLTINDPDGFTLYCPQEE